MAASCWFNPAFTRAAAREIFGNFWVCIFWITSVL
nr:MAG TPA: hypothetical protein [Caudoviricetes sp.]